MPTGCWWPAWRHSTPTPAWLCLWFHPLTLRGHGTTYVATFPAGTYDGPNAGLILGTDVNSIAGA